MSKQSKNKILIVFNCGTIVKIKMANIQGMISAINVRFDRIQYEVKYFLDGEQQSVWLNEEEFEYQSGKTLTIGYKYNQI